MTEGSEAGPIRIGVARPDRPPGLIAEIEARVIRAELERRLGATTVDLRVDGAPIGAWASRDSAAWPADVDAVVPPDLLWSDDLPPLTALFGRTLDDVAIEIRSHMLDHLGCSDEPIDDRVVADEVPWRPTDVWLLARRNGVSADTDPRLQAMAEGDATAADLDGAFDAAADHIADTVGPQRMTTIIARLRRHALQLDADHRAAVELAHRNVVEAATLVDELRAENAVLRERDTRRALDDPSARS